MGAGDPRFVQPTESCMEGSEERAYVSRTFVNTSTSDVHADIGVSYEDGGDGFLHVYRGMFADTAPTRNCVWGDDDFQSIAESALFRISWPAGSSLTVVLSGYGDVSSLNAAVTVVESF